MGRQLHKKIDTLLRERDFAEKDLAAALGITNQSLQDILKGRGSVNVQILQGLVRFFGIRADYWINDEKAEPTTDDVVPTTDGFSTKTLEKMGISKSKETGNFVTKIRDFIKDHPEEWATQFGPLTREELDILDGKDS